MVPVAVETMGAWVHSSLKFVQEIGERIKMASGDQQVTFKILQKISFEIQRGNIASILGRNITKNPNRLIVKYYYEFLLFCTVVSY